jgi:hypothetical protein
MTSTPGKRPAAWSKVGEQFKTEQTLLMTEGKAGSRSEGQNFPVAPSSTSFASARDRTPLVTGVLDKTSKLVSLLASAIKPSDSYSIRAAAVRITMCLLITRGLLPLRFKALFCTWPKSPFGSLDRVVCRIRNKLTMIDDPSVRANATYSNWTAVLFLLERDRYQSANIFVLLGSVIGVVASSGAFDLGAKRGPAGRTIAATNICGDHARIDRPNLARSFGTNASRRSKRCCLVYAQPCSFGDRTTHRFLVADRSRETTGARFHGHSALARLCAGKEHRH